MLGVEINFLVVFGPIIDWFWCMDRNWFGFGAGIAIGFFFVRAENDFLLKWRSIVLGLLCVVEIDFISVWEIELDLILVQRSELTWFLWNG